MVTASLSVAGTLAFAGPSWWHRFFCPLVCESVIAAREFFLGFFKFNPAKVQADIERYAVSEIIAAKNCTGTFR